MCKDQGDDEDQGDDDEYQRELMKLQIKKLEEWEGEEELEEDKD